MTTQIKRRRGTTTEHSTFTGAEGEITIDTTKDTVVVHDGSTAGGHPLAKESSIAGKVDSSGDTMTGDLTVPNVIVSGNVDGRDVSVDGTKLDGIEAGADVTDATNVAAAGAAMETGAAFTGNVTFGDNDKAIFGAGSDLQIYHDGQHSYIYEGGTGNLKIQAGNFRVQDTTGTKAMFYADENAEAAMAYNGATKLATTSTGIDVTGTVTADGLDISTLSGDATVYLQNAASARGMKITKNYDDFSANVFYSLHPTAKAGSLAFKGSQDSTQLFINSNGDISFYEGTGTTPKFFWDASAESLGIGTSSPSRLLTVSPSTGSAQIALVSQDSSLSEVLFGDAADDNVGRVYYDHASNYMSLWTNTSERMRIDSSGNVGIGTTSPTTTLTLDSGGTPTTLKIDSLTESSIDFDDKGGSAKRYKIGTNISSNDGQFEFKDMTAGAERMRIDSSGNLLVGKTSVDTTTDGLVMRERGQVYATSDGNTPVILNRRSSDGDILQLRKDNNTVGSIGAGGGRLYIGSADTGVYFDEGVDSIFPYNPTTRQSRDNAIDLGYSTIRYKDLYLSGGVYLGGTGSANKLDDYEEGTWIPVLTDFTNNSPTSARGAYYTKIGNIVFASCNFINVDTTGMTSGAELYLDDLPYTSKSTTGTNYFVAGGVQYSGTSVTNQPIPSIVDGTDYMRFFDSGTFWSVSNLTDDAADLYINVVYLAA